MQQEVTRTITVQASSNNGGGPGGGNGGSSGGNTGGSTPSVPTTPTVPTTPSTPETGPDSSTEVKVEVEANQPVQTEIKTW